MTEWLQIISYLLTNGLRFFLGLFLATKLMGASPDRKALALSILSGVLVTVSGAAGLSSTVLIAAEMAVLAASTWYYVHKQFRLCLFLIFFYEVGASLWEFLISSGMSLLFHSTKFMDPAETEYLVSIWLTRILMAAFEILLVKRQSDGKGQAIQPASVAAVLGMFGVISLSQQTIFPLSDDQFLTWIILSMVLLFAVFVYRVNRQHEMEAEIALLKQEQTEILERDYQNLSQTYADNAKLYHDFHNHIEAVYQCLAQGDIAAAVRYCEDLRTPVQKISQTVWTGDKAADYLISSKMELAEQRNIQTRVNIEYPYNTNIRSVDLTTILGNLLDNAIEGSETAPDKLRFLNLTIRRIHDMLIIKVENGCGKVPVFTDGKLQTSKKEKALHGWGIQSVLTAAERYDGTIDTDYENGIFRSVVTLSYRPVKIK